MNRKKTEDILKIKRTVTKEPYLHALTNVRKQRSEFVTPFFVAPVRGNYANMITVETSVWILFNGWELKMKLFPSSVGVVPE